MVNLFFTADLHFGHARINELAKRPFDSVDEMNEALINNWNEVVGFDDTVIVLGDVALGKIDESLPLVNHLNGNKFLTPGNHDRIFSANKQKYIDRFMPDYERVFSRILPENHYIVLGEYFVGLSHFPYAGDSHAEDRYAYYRPANYGLPLICGHVHEKWRQKDEMFNVGVDVNNFTPVHEDEVVNWLDVLTLRYGAF